MIDIVVTAFFLSLPVMIGLDKRKQQLSALLFVIIITPIGVEIIFGAPKGFRWTLLLFQVICWLAAFKLALRCKRVSDTD